MKGHVYFLVNDAMPGMVKIGYTKKNLEGRVNQLNTTGVPLPFIIGASFHVSKPDECEKKLHKLFDKYRINGSREFFAVTLAQAIEKSLEIIQGHIADSIARPYKATTVSDSDTVCAINLGANELTILLYLAQQSYAVSARIIDSLCANAGHLVVISHLVNLKKLGYAVERSSRKQAEVNRWAITSEGIKYLFDVGELSDKTDFLPDYL